MTDASVALKWFVEEEGAAEAFALLNRENSLIAPDLILAEVGNAAWKCLVQSRMTQEQYTRAANVLPALFAELVPLTRLASQAWQIAASINHPVYDAFYLALAELYEAPLVTADTRLLRRVRGSQWQNRVQGLVT